MPELLSLNVNGETHIVEVDDPPLICRCGTHGAALRAVKRAAQAT